MGIELQKKACNEQSCPMLYWLGGFAGYRMQANNRTFDDMADQCPCHVLAGDWDYGEQKNKPICTILSYAEGVWDD